MSGFSIPLDTLTSRLNLNGFSENMRSQAVTTRFANLKPISEFLDFKRLSKPANFADVQTRVNYNIGYFSSNYFVMVLMLGVYSVLTNLVLLFDIGFISASLWIIRRLKGQDLDIGFVRLTSPQLYTGMLIIGVPLTIYAKPLGTALWLVGAIGVSTLGHAAFMDKPIESAFSEEAV